MTVRADFVAVSRDDFFVLGLLGHVGGVAAHTEGVDLILREHRIRRGTITSRRPGFVGDMCVTGTVTTGTSYGRLGVHDGKLLLRKIDMTDVTSAVIGTSANTCCCTFVTEKQRFFLQQKRFVIQ